MGIGWLYNRGLFDRWRMEQMARHYVRVLDQVVEDEERRIQELELLGPEERQRILHTWNGPEVEYAVKKCLGEWFEEQVEQRRDAVAVVCGERQLSYGELNVRANRLAHRLIRGGVGPESVVGIVQPRSLELMVSVVWLGMI